MFEAIQIAPSILSADFMNMERSIREIEKGQAGYVHVDVMDGHFVPNITMGVPLVKQLKKITDLPLDVHLMVSNPLTQIPWFLDAGADILTVHFEALDTEEEVRQSIALIHDGGARAALSLKPQTPVELIEPYIDELDMVLIMSVHPGFSGQSYIAGSEDRIAAVVDMARKAKVSPLIEVDGGIDTSTARLVALAGADVLVAGNAVFGAVDKEKAIKDIIEAATKDFRST